MGRLLRLLMIVLSMLPLLFGTAHAMPLQQSADFPPLENWIVASDDRGNHLLPGCDSIAVYDISKPSISFQDNGFAQSPAQLTASSDGTIILGTFLHGPRAIQGITNRVRSDGQWQPIFLASDLMWKRALLVTRDDRSLILPYVSGIGKHPLSDVYTSNPGPDMFRPGKLPQPQQTLRDMSPAALVDSLDASTLYSADIQGLLYRIDLERFQIVEPGLPYPVTAGPSVQRTLRTYMAISPDGRFLVINGGNVARLSIIEIDTWTIRTAQLDGLTTSWGVSFNYRSHGEVLLAVHGRNRIGVYRFRGKAEPQLLVSASLAPYTIPGGQFPLPPDTYVAPDITWSGDGTKLVAAAGGDINFPIFEFSNGPSYALRSAGGFKVCNDQRWPSTPQQVLSFNLPTYITPTPTITRTPLASDTPTLTPTLPATATPTPSRTASPSATPTRTPSPMPTASATPTPLPGPIHLPLLLRERCQPEQRRVDAVLVLDASLSMLEPAAPGSTTTKLEASRAAAAAFLDALRLDAGDRAGIVAFNAEASLLSPLTDRRDTLDAALLAIQAAPQTCLVCGLDLGARALEAAMPVDPAGGRAAVLVLLTDGRSNPRPAAEAVVRAAEAKAAGQRIYAIGLGPDTEEEALRSIASGPAAYFHAPSAAELAGIYRGIAVDIPCPAGAFWAGR